MLRPRAHGCGIFFFKNRELVHDFVKVEVRRGNTISFWYDNWSSLGQMIDLTGTCGYIDLGITTNATVKHVIHTHRRRRHIVDVLNSIENTIENVRRGYNTNKDDKIIWKVKADAYTYKFNTSLTWNQIRQY